MARNEDADSSRTDFYIVIGQAPRYLDRNLSIFGRVIDGMATVQQIRRGPVSNNGVFIDDTASTRISSMKLLSEFPPEEQLKVYYQRLKDKMAKRINERMTAPKQS